ncbi:hypothetical protein RKD46_001668 [Streptomyces pseudovenezuelae]
MSTFREARIASCDSGTSSSPTPSRSRPRIDVVAVAVAPYDVHRGEPLQVVVAQRPPRPPPELLARDPLHDVRGPGGHHGPVDREVVGAQTGRELLHVPLDRRERHPLVLELLDQREAREVLAAVVTDPARTDHRRRQQAARGVEADRADRDAGPRGQLVDGEGLLLGTGGGVGRHVQQYRCLTIAVTPGRQPLSDHVRRLPL